jgi:glycerol kinase
MTAILALDQGTTSSRALVFDESGAQLAMAQRELRQIFPRPGWVEHDPVEIWESQLAVAREALAAARIGAAGIAALGITNQRETVVVWERATGRPIANAIVWQDRRTAPVCERLRRDGWQSRVAARTGLTLDPYFSATKLAWLLDHQPGARAAAAAGRLAFGTVDSWLIWNLTGGEVHATDASNASRTLLYDLEAGDWDPELLRLFDVPREVLPPVRASGEIYGEAAAGWLGAAIPIAGVVGDQQAALFGQACFSPGMAKSTYGTGAFLLLNTGRRPVRSSHGLLCSPAWRLPGGTDFALEGSVFVAGAAVQWLRDGLGLFRAAADVEALAASVPDSAGVVLVPAFTGLGAPHWSAGARGALLGLTRGTTAAHLARATLEGIAHQVVDILCAMAADLGGVNGQAVAGGGAAGALADGLGELRVDGGAAANDLLLQIQADLAGVPVVRPRVRETTALGAAYLAGLTTGVFRGLDEIAARWQPERRFEPAASPAWREESRERWTQAVRATLQLPGAQPPGEPRDGAAERAGDR